MDKSLICGRRWSKFRNKREREREREMSEINRNISRWKTSDAISLYIQAKLGFWPHGEQSLRFRLVHDV